ncbi:thrombospondin type 3 repeat-containing protein [Vibrio penaeicida]|uniref:thrombospondin type 3 repeat-containing protein n=1 Tax=Vibrio penaeicida TaxID=104609 RepID=UPI002732D60C|nr:thrombospondin type 3 repeat-containing protein [Vibrio penaeicida]MDP2571710.1 thrombospondin type 3 repeat-containing protein [Vibrio penaeicida]
MFGRTKLYLSFIITIFFGLSHIANASEVVVYTSDNTVGTYQPIYPAYADGNWTNSVCNVDSSIGLDANWLANGNAYQFGTNAHPWQPGVQLDAQWINAWANLGSQGPGGHSWTRYTLEVTGVGDFDLSLLADNCSWVYLDGNLVGFQSAYWNVNNLTYPVQLSGTHSLDFIIFDGGGLAGGMFKLETNTGRTYSDDDGDGLSNQEEILVGTSPTNPDTDADGVSDGEEVSAGSDPLDDTSFPVVDSDQDGIEDADDYCSDTEYGAVVDAQGCSGAQIVAQMCSCSGPSENQAWKSHGQYVSCVVRARKVVLKSGLITEEEGEIIVEAAAQSSCGKKN